MLESLTLDQLRVFLAVAETKSFKKAAQQLYRTQGAVSYNIAQLEKLLGFKVFHRAGKKPTLTSEGKRLLVEAENILAQVEKLGRVHHGLQDGLESNLSISIDILFPTDRLVQLTHAFQESFPTVPLTLSVSILERAIQDVQDGHCQLGVTGVSQLGKDYRHHRCGEVELVPVVSSTHPLATVGQQIDEQTLRNHTHLVLSDQWPDTQDAQTIGLTGGKIWRMTDMSIRHELLRAGLGWCRMPRHVVASDLNTGRLVALKAVHWKHNKFMVPLQCFYHQKRPLGPAGRWLLKQLTSMGQDPDSSEEITEDEVIQSSV
mgnify:CR=1 FL=1